MKKQLIIFSIFAIISNVAFGQIPDPTYTAKKLRGAFNFVVGNDTVKLYPEYGISLDTLYFADDTKQYSGFTASEYVATAGDTMSGALVINDDLTVSDSLIHNGLITYSIVETKLAGTLFTAPAGIQGYGTFSDMNTSNYATFTFATDGTVTLINATQDIKNTDTGSANDYCIYDAGSGFVIKYYSGLGTVTYTLEIKYQ